MDEAPYALKLILGVSGSLSFYAIFKSVFEHCPPTSVITFGAKLGGATLGIYILDVIIFAVIIPRYVSFNSFPLYVVILIMPLISAALLLLFYSITSVISRSKKLAWLLLGHGFN
jgi:surface polysaccharide O-acyltransferase-like enzyme